MRRAGIFSHVQLDSIGYADATPGDRFISAQCHFISAHHERRLERARDALLEHVAGEHAHFLLDCFERLAFTLPDLHREKLQQVTVVIRCRGSSSVRAIHQAG